MVPPQMAGKVAEKADLLKVGASTRRLLANVGSEEHGGAVADLVAFIEGGDKKASKHALMRHCHHPPFATALLVAIYAATFYSRQHDQEDYDTWAYSEDARGSSKGWILSWNAHLTVAHVTSNIVLMSMVGPLLESTEGPVVLLYIFFAVFFVGNAFHGHFNKRTIVGASGGIYSVEFAQLATLAMNWEEMQLRYLRLATVLGIAVVEVVGYYASHKSWVSYAAHIGGAFAGVLVGIVVVRNVAVRKHEIKLTWACVSIYTLTSLLLCVVPPAQPAAAGCGGACEKGAGISSHLIFYRTQLHTRRCQPCWPSGTASSPCSWRDHY